jgi:hypothetical protein
MATSHQETPHASTRQQHRKADGGKIKIGKKRLAKEAQKQNHRAGNGKGVVVENPALAADHSHGDNHHGKRCSRGRDGHQQDYAQGQVGVPSEHKRRADAQAQTYVPAKSERGADPVAKRRVESVGHPQPIWGAAARRRFLSPSSAPWSP